MLPFEEHLDHLKYPTLPIDGSIAQYLSRSRLVSMASNPDHLSEDTTSSLGDSTYEILSESTFFTSEDEDNEDNADWVTANGQEAPDDLASVADTDDTRHTGEADCSGSHTREDNLSALGYIDRETEDGGEDSSPMITRGHDHLSVQSIEFEEPQLRRGGEQVDVIHTVYKFSHEEASKIGANAFSAGESVQYVATIRQTMTRQGLVLDRPFRVVFIGDASAHDVIVEKVAAALAVPSSWGPASHDAHRRSSRFNIIPISSFGNDASPEIELIDSSGLEIVVDQCTSAKLTREISSQEIITLALNESVQCQSTKGYHGSKAEFSGHWQLPDMAIVYCSSADDPPARRTRDLAHLFMSRHEVPSVVISQEPLWETSTVPQILDYRGPHLCLESRGVNVSDNRVLRRLPVDLASFKNIDSGQMNRNLACLTGLHTGKDYPQAIKRKNWTTNFDRVNSSEDLEKASNDTSRLIESISRLRGLIRSNGGAVLLIATLVVYTIAYTFAPMVYLKPSQTPRQTAAFSIPTGLSPVPPATTSTPSTPSLVISNSGLSSPVVQGIKSSDLKTVSVRDTYTDLASLLWNPSVIALNESNKFEVQVFGDCHIILRLPKSLTLRRNRPELSVKVLRNEVIIEHELSALFESVYAIKVKQEDAYGSLNVSVWPKSWKSFNQTLVVDFGTPSFKTHGWKKVVEVMSADFKNEYNTRLCEMRVMLGRMGSRMQGITRTSTSNAAVFLGAATRTEETPLQRISGTKNRVVLRINALSRLVSRQAANHSKQLVKESVRLSKKSLLLSKRIRGSLGSQAKDVSAFGARYLTMLCNAATGVDPAKLWIELSKIPPVDYKQSLRPVQKTALRLWRRLSRAKAKKPASPHSPPKARKSRFSSKRNR